MRHVDPARPGNPVSPHLVVRAVASAVAARWDHTGEQGRVSELARQCFYGASHVTRLVIQNRVAMSVAEAATTVG
jgi:hypothetical protein